MTEEQPIFNNEQITAYISMRGGRSITTIRSHGKFIKEVPTVKSQIRKPRESCLWKVGDE